MNLSQRPVYNKAGLVKRDSADLSTLEVHIGDVIPWRCDSFVIPSC